LNRGIAEREPGIPRKSTNLHGGISIGHPPGATGAAHGDETMHHLADTGQRNAVISMCPGSGVGMATPIERVG
jgi:acetyl-CoA C-acetyltransferase